MFGPLFAGEAMGPAPRLPGVRVLAADRLRVEVMDPADPERYYRGPRFSPVAGVLRAAWAGKDYLYAPAAHDPLTENGGLAMEFDMACPPGFAEAAEGEGFLKIGVGVLRKSGDGGYQFYKPYELLAPAPTEAEWGKDRASFRQRCAGVRGYAYELEAEVRLDGAAILIHCRLSNTGTKPWSTESYAHNYFLLDGRPVGPGYELEFSGDFDAENLAVLEKAGRKLAFAAPIPVSLKAVNARVFPPAGRSHGPDAVTVRCPAAGMALTARVSLPVAFTAVHATPRYLCPEQFVRIRLAPGESVKWTRTYAFAAE